MSFLQRLWGGSKAVSSTVAVSSAFVDANVELTSQNAVLLVWPKAKLETLPEEAVVEPFLPGLSFFYGVRARGHIGSLTQSDLDSSGLDLEALRRHALRNMEVGIDALDVAPLQEGTPVLTNHFSYAHAATLLADTNAWRELCDALGGPLVVAVPSPSRLFIAPDTVDYRAALRSLADQAREVEDEILTEQLLCFDGERWSLAAPLN